MDDDDLVKPNPVHRRINIDFPRGRCCFRDKSSDGAGSRSSGRLCCVLPEGGRQTPEGLFRYFVHPF
jgi:hypothetical protein